MTTLSTTARERIALARPAQGGPGGGAPTATDVLAMLRRRLVLIAVLFALFGSAAVGGFYVWWRYFPGYRTSALIECISNIPDVELTLEQTRLHQDEHERFVMTQALLLKSPSILGEALKVTAVRDTQWYRSIPKDHLLELTEQLSAAPIRGTNFLKVSMECRSKTDPAIIVNEVVREWFDSVKKRSAEEFAEKTLEAARQERRALEAEIESDRLEQRRLANRLPAGAIQDPGGNITNQNVKQFAEQLATLQLEKSVLEQYRAVYNNPNGVAVTSEDRAFVEQDPQVADLAARLFSLKQERAAAEKVYGSEHAYRKQLEALIEATDAKLFQLREEKLNQRRADMREQTNTAYNSTQQALFLAEERLLKAEGALQDQDSLLFEYTNLEAELARKLERKRALTDTITSLNRVKTQRTAINVNVTQEALPPLQRSSPKLLLLPMGIFLALALSVGIALGLELLDNTIRTSQDIVRHLDVVLLGLIPHTDDEEIAIECVETAVRDAPQSMVAEAFRRIRTNLQFSAPAERQRLVLITSPRPDDGKTTVAVNLAMAIAQGGRRVLLVDANFRRPRIHRFFDHAAAPGLSNILIGDTTLAASAARTTTPLLDILGSGPTPPNPVDLLMGEPCRTFLEEAAAHYDQVVIDTAPVLLASDAILLGKAVDGVILVIRAKQNSRGVTRRACTLFTDAGVHLFGAVLNAAQVARGGYFREELRTYYEYQLDDAVEGSSRSLMSKKKDDPSTPAE